MPTRTWGCKNRRCYPFEFDSQDEAPRCPQCGGETKWVPGLTQVIRPMQQRDAPRSKLKEAESIMQGLIDSHNARVDLPGLKLYDVPSASKRPTPPEPERRVPWTFKDAYGKPWNVDLPARRDGSIINQTSAIGAKGVEQKVSFKPETRRGTDQVPRLAGGTKRA